ncbi:hypothetical protein BU16DRAFT_289050 [Lophium mytilinum]|uniref:Uncharacterized protein n=1 Tax=Lophium mytilinum TaxID=390894 RepID=A0A6A6R0J4_9PEZI|nr:hypothetical protein BU16DRAFT_289050 [Lophium mytilinum]
MKSCSRSFDPRHTSPHPDLRSSVCSTTWLSCVFPFDPPFPPPTTSPTSHWSSPYMLLLMKERGVIVLNSSELSSLSTSLPAQKSSLYTPSETTPRGLIQRSCVRCWCHVRAVGVMCALLESCGSRISVMGWGIKIFRRLSISRNQGFAVFSSKHLRKFIDGEVATMHWRPSRVLSKRQRNGHYERGGVGEVELPQ